MVSFSITILFESIRYYLYKSVENNFFLIENHYAYALSHTHTLMRVRMYITPLSVVTILGCTRYTSGVLRFFNINRGNYF